MPVLLIRQEVLDIVATVRHIRYKAIIDTTYGADLRISEVAAFSNCQVELKQPPFV